MLPARLTTVQTAIGRYRASSQVTLDRVRRSRALALARDVLTWGLAMAAAALLIVSAYYFRPRGIAEFPELAKGSTTGVAFTREYLLFVDVNDSLNKAARLMIAGGACLVAALVFNRRSITFAQAITRSLTPNRSRWTAVVTGVLLLFMVAEISGNAIRFDRLVGVSIEWQYWLLVGGIVFVAWGLGGELLPRQRSTIDWREVRTVSGILGAALLLRVWELNNTIRVFVDELNFAIGALDIRRFDQIPLLRPMTGVVAFPHLYCYWQSKTVALFGRNFVGIRLPSAIIGALTVLALYMLARTLFDRRTATIAAVFLTAWPVHLHYSRLGMNNIAEPLFGTLAFTFLARAMQTGHRRNYALAGVSLGLTQYFYEGGRLLYPPLMLAWVVIGLLIWRRRPSFRGLLIMLLAAILVAAPVYYTLLALDAPLTARLDATGIGSGYIRDLLLSSPGDPIFEEHLQHIKDTFLIYVYQPDTSYYYGGHTPLALIYLAPMLLSGGFVALWRVRSPGALLLVLWVLGTSIGNSFMAASTHTTRYVVVLPALALLCALGLRTTLTMIWPDDRAPRTRRTVLIQILLIVSVAQVIYYFVPHLNLYNYDIRHVQPQPDGTDALLRSANFPPGTQVHLVSRVPFNRAYAVDVIRYLADGVSVDTLTPDDVTDRYLQGLARDVDHAFYVEPGDTITIIKLKRFFTVGQPLFSPYPIPPDEHFDLYYVRWR
ncbi:MAG: glycosyltransferase family 39 protein [Anaerolineae bacterium]|nr:glycosyltransferase family 39 protein [Anaerolineae bacterium]